MTLDDFWALIERSRSAGAERTEWLTEQLAGLPAEDILDFEGHLAAQRKRVDTWPMWEVGLYLTQGLCSEDGFFYFQPWLVGLGREAFERVAADPDALADVPEVRRLAGRPVKKWADDEWPDWELLNYVALEAYARITGEEDGLDNALAARGLDRVCNPDPDGERWDLDSAEERAAHIPRLAALLGRR